jgi:Ala-tRNA(Pro) deacylase
LKGYFKGKDLIIVCLNNCDYVYEELKKLNIEYEVVSHPPALDIKTADEYIEGKEGLRTKTLFLCDKKKKNYFLLAMDENKRIDIKALAEKLNQRSLSFVSEERMLDLIGLKPGMVSVFGILNDTNGKVTVVLDKDMQGETLTFYANDCTKTVFLSFDSVIKFIEGQGNEMELLDL